MKTQEELKSDLNARARLWQTSEPENLARNFHYVKEQPKLGLAIDNDDSIVNYQFVKSNSFPFSDFGVLKKVADSITQIRIWMALAQYHYPLARPGTRKCTRSF